MNWRKIPSSIKRFLALFGGYFWLPCPLCGKYFAGFETADHPYMTSYGGGSCVCQSCDNKASELNKINWKSFLDEEERKMK